MREKLDSGAYSSASEVMRDAGEALTVVHYTEEAENDLFEIGVCTWTEWGEEQSAKYLGLLRET